MLLSFGFSQTDFGSEDGQGCWRKREEDGDKINGVVGSRVVVGLVDCKVSSAAVVRGKEWGVTFSPLNRIHPRILENS